MHQGLYHLDLGLCVQVTEFSLIVAYPSRLSYIQGPRPKTPRPSIQLLDLEKAERLSLPFSRSKSHPAWPECKAIHFEGQYILANLSLQHYGTYDRYLMDYSDINPTVEELLLFWPRIQEYDKEMKTNWSRVVESELKNARLHQVLTPGMPVLVSMAETYLRCIVEDYAAHARTVSIKGDSFQDQKGLEACFYSLSPGAFIRCLEPSVCAGNIGRVVRTHGTAVECLVIQCNEIKEVRFLGV
jgi:hypothetical protein